MPKPRPNIIDRIRRVVTGKPTKKEVAMPQMKTPEPEKEDEDKRKRKKRWVSP